VFKINKNMQPEYKFKKIYSPKSNRLQNYDYGSNWWYFITICTKDRQNYFGEIIDWKMILNDFWKIVFDEIIKIPKMKENILLYEFIIMPNHIHLILMINNDVETTIYRVSNNDVELNWDTINGCLYEKWNWYTINHCFYEKWWTLMKDKNIMLNKNHIWFIIRKFKWKSTFLINKMQNKIFFSWQPNYYDRIIRNEDELQRIRKYILDNPLKWELDKENSENLFM